MRVRSTSSIRFDSVTEETIWRTDELLKQADDYLRDLETVDAEIEIKDELLNWFLEPCLTCDISVKDVLDEIPVNAACKTCEQYKKWFQKAELNRTSHNNLIRQFGIAGRQSGKSHIWKKYIDNMIKKLPMYKS